VAVRGRSERGSGLGLAPLSRRAELVRLGLARGDAVVLVAELGAAEGRADVDYRSGTIAKVAER